MIRSPLQYLQAEYVNSPRHRAIKLLSLLVVGLVACWGLFGRGVLTLLTLGPWGWQALLLFVVITGAIAALPPVAAFVELLLCLLREPSPTARQWSTFVAASLTGGFLLETAIREHRQMWPCVHDEFSYLIQARQFAAGHLSMPAHPLADFFDSFQLFSTPVYASAYFPGTALIYVPGIWLHLPAWVTSVAIAAVIGGMLYRITTEMIDGVAGWLAMLLLWSDRLFRSLSTMTMAQLPLLLFGLLTIYAWLKWRRSRQIRWTFAIGVSGGLAAIARPVDSLCFAVPIAIAMAFEMLSRDPCHTSARVTPQPVESPSAGKKLNEKPRAAVVIPSLIFVLLGAAPSLLLQLVLNSQITGHVLETPFRLYADRDYPGTAYGFHPFDPGAKPASTLPQKIALYREDQPLIQHHRFWSTILNQVRLRLICTQGTPAPFPVLFPLLPLALVGIDRRRAVVLAALPLFIMLYAGYVFFFPHYVLTTASALIIGVLAGAGQAANGFPRHRRRLVVFLTLLIGGLAVVAFPQWDENTSDDTFDAPLIADVNRQLSTLPHRPAVVLFRYNPSRNLNEEPVYNVDVAWPDDAPVIRAHDLGPRNIELFRYYAARSPARMVYRYDERSRQLTELGTVLELAKRKFNPSSLP